MKNDGDDDNDDDVDDVDADIVIADVSEDGGSVCG